MFALMNKAGKAAYLRQYRIKNKDKLDAYLRAYYANNRESLTAQNREYVLRNKEKTAAYQAWYRKENAERIRAVKNRYKRKKWRENVAYRLREIVSNATRRLVKYGWKKDGKTIRHLGCSAEELRAHIESRFKPGMTWDNHGVHGWHIDHIKPLVSFDLDNREEWGRAMHYTNLQPLWAKENIMKGTAA